MTSQSELSLGITNINELFSLEKHCFIASAYKILIGRDADEHGMRYYLGRMAIGYSMVDVIDQLARSPECKVRGKIEGLDMLLRNNRRQKHWFWRFFVWPRTENYMKVEVDSSALTEVFDQLSGFLSANRTKDTDRINRLLMKTEAGFQDLKLQLSSLKLEVNRLSLSSGPGFVPVPVPVAGGGVAVAGGDVPVAGLLRQDVIDEFMCVLNRYPENQELTDLEKRLFSSRCEVRNYLMNSDEFLIS